MASFDEIHPALSGRRRGIETGSGAAHGFKQRARLGVHRVAAFVQGVGRDDHSQAVGLGIGQRTQKDGVEHAVDSGVRSNAQP